MLVGRPQSTSVLSYPPSLMERRKCNQRYTFLAFANTAQKWNPLRPGCRCQQKTGRPSLIERHQRGTLCPSRRRQQQHQFVSFDFPPFPPYPVSCPLWRGEGLRATDPGEGDGPTINHHPSNGLPCMNPPPHASPRNPILIPTHPSHCRPIAPVMPPSIRYRIPRPALSWGRGIFSTHSSRRLSRPRSRAVQVARAALLSLSLFLRVSGIAARQGTQYSRTLSTGRARERERAAQGSRRS